jgi:hypothetical protein
LTDIAMLTGEGDPISLNKKVNYLVRTGKLDSPRKGIYTKPDYNTEELACVIYTPTYISLEYVLHKAGIIFQYDSTITSISYLSRSIAIDGQQFSFRKIKNEIIIDTSGLIRKDNGINIATPERAFLDMLYLSPNFYFDNLNPLNKKIISKLLPIYKSQSLVKRTINLLKNV